MSTNRIKQACSETLILSLLAAKPMHGYDMCKELEKRSNGYFQLRHGTLYPLLHKMEKAGLVKSKWGELDSGKPRRYYSLTKKGASYQRDNLASWRELLASLIQLVPEVAP